MDNDYLGSTNVVTNASGTPIQTLDYMPYLWLDENQFEFASRHEREWRPARWCSI